MKTPTYRTPRCGHADQHTKEDVGGIRLVRHGMQVAIRTPCAECPLRRDSRPRYLGGYTAEMYLDIMHSPASVACHLSPGFQEGQVETQRHCTGVAAFRAAVGHVCHVGGVLADAHESTLAVGADHEVFLSSVPEFLEHHGRPEEKRRFLERIAKVLGLNQDVA
jgi:hypothetical protein